MTQKEISERLGMARSTMHPYLKQYGKPAKYFTEEDVEKLKSLINGYAPKKEKKEIKLTKTQEKKLNKLGLATKKDGELQKTTDKSFILEQLRVSYNVNKQIIEDCIIEITAHGAFVTDDYGNVKPNPAIRLRQDTEKSQRETIKLMNDLQEMQLVAEEVESEDMSDLM